MRIRDGDVTPNNSSWSAELTERERERQNVNEKEKEKNSNHKKENETGISSMNGLDTATSSFLNLLIN